MISILPQQHITYANTDQVNTFFSPCYNRNKPVNKTETPKGSQKEILLDLGSGKEGSSVPWGIGGFNLVWVLVLTTSRDT